MLTAPDELSSMPLERLLACARLEKEKYQENIKWSHRMRHLVCRETFHWLRDFAYQTKCHCRAHSASRASALRRCLTCFQQAARRHRQLLQLRARGGGLWHAAAPRTAIRHWRRAAHKRRVLAKARRRGGELLRRARLAHALAELHASAQWGAHARRVTSRLRQKHRLSSWREWLPRRRLERKRARASVAAWLHRGAQHGMHHWISYWRARREGKELRRRSASLRHDALTLRRVLSSWRACCFLTYLVNRTRRHRGWYRWLLVVLQRKYLADADRLGKLHRRKRGFESLRDKRASRLKAAVRTATAVRQLTRASTAQTFRTWRAALRQHVVDSATMCRITTGKRCIGIWLDRLALLKGRSIRSQTAQGAWVRSTLRRILRHFVAGAEWKAQCRRASSLMRRASMKNGFTIWCAWTQWTLIGSANMSVGKSACNQHGVLLAIHRWMVFQSVRLRAQALHASSLMFGSDSISLGKSLAKWRSWLMSEKLIQQHRMRVAFATAWRHILHCLQRSKVMGAAMKVLADAKCKRTLRVWLTDAKVLKLSSKRWRHAALMGRRHRIANALGVWRAHRADSMRLEESRKHVRRFAKSTWTFGRKHMWYLWKEYAARQVCRQRWASAAKAALLRWRARRGFRAISTASRLEKSARAAARMRGALLRGYAPPTAVLSWSRRLRQFHIWHRLVPEMTQDNHRFRTGQAWWSRYSKLRTLSYWARLSSARAASIRLLKHSILVGYRQMSLRNAVRTWRTSTSLRLLVARARRRRAWRRLLLNRLCRTRLKGAAQAQRMAEGSRFVKALRDVLVRRSTVASFRRRSTDQAHRRSLGRAVQRWKEVSWSRRSLKKRFALVAKRGTLASLEHSAALWRQFLHLSQHSKLARERALIAWTRLSIHSLFQAWKVKFNARLTLSRSMAYCRVQLVPRARLRRAFRCFWLLRERARRCGLQSNRRRSQRRAFSRWAKKHKVHRFLAVRVTTAGCIRRYVLSRWQLQIAYWSQRRGFLSRWPLHLLLAQRKRAIRRWQTHHAHVTMMKDVLLKCGKKTVALSFGRWRAWAVTLRALWAMRRQGDAAILRAVMQKATDVWQRRVGKGHPANHLCQMDSLPQAFNQLMWRRTKNLVERDVRKLAYRWSITQWRARIIERATQDALTSLPRAFLRRRRRIHGITRWVGCLNTRVVQRSHEDIIRWNKLRARGRILKVWGSRTANTATCAARVKAFGMRSSFKTAMAKWRSHISSKATALAVGRRWYSSNRKRAMRLWEDATEFRVGSPRGMSERVQERRRKANDLRVATLRVVMHRKQRVLACLVSGLGSRQDNLQLFHQAEGTARAHRRKRGFLAFMTMSQQRALLSLANTFRTRKICRAGPGSNHGRHKSGRLRTYSWAALAFWSTWKKHTLAWLALSAISRRVSFFKPIIRLRHGFLLLQYSARASRHTKSMRRLSRRGIARNFNRWVRVAYERQMWYGQAGIHQILKTMNRRNDRKSMHYSLQLAWVRWSLCASCHNRVKQAQLAAKEASENASAMLQAALLSQRQQLEKATQDMHDHYEKILDEFRTQYSQSPSRVPSPEPSEPVNACTPMQSTKVPTSGRRAATVASRMWRVANSPDWLNSPSVSVASSCADLTPRLEMLQDYASPTSPLCHPGFPHGTPMVIAHKPPKKSPLSRMKK